VTRPGRERLGWQEIEDIRHERGRSTLLFITDRCPVGCAHCSVDSRRDSPTITDFALFGEIVEWLVAQDHEVVGISGGEPFVERRGLALAARRITEEGKRLVVYTSGVWAKRPDPPAWIADVLDRCETVYLSTDAFHAEGVGDGHYVHAARAIERAGAWIVVQVVDVDAMVERAHDLLLAAFGDSYEDYAELVPTAPLTAGRGADVFMRTKHEPGRDYRACTLVASPIVRYDGVVTACCNESVIMGWGPEALRRRASSREELDAAFAGFRADPMLRAIGGVGPGALTAHPRFADLADEQFTSICDLCWKLFDRTVSDIEPDPLVAAVAGVLVDPPVGVGR
jgi:organic radical activating enzyme